MTFEEYEREAERTSNLSLGEKERLLDAAAGLAEESGEVLGAVRKHVFFDHPLDRDKLRIELGDALWCLAMSARAAGLSLEEIAAANLAKLRARYPDGFSREASKVARD